VGVTQVNFILPNDIPAGVQAVAVSAGGGASAAVSLNVQPASAGRGVAILAVRGSRRAGSRRRDPPEHDASQQSPVASRFRKLLMNSRLFRPAPVEGQTIATGPGPHPQTSLFGMTAETRWRTPLWALVPQPD